MDACDASVARVPTSPGDNCHIDRTTSTCDAGRVIVCHSRNGQCLPKTRVRGVESPLLAAFGASKADSTPGWRAAVATQELLTARRRSVVADIVC